MHWQFQANRIKPNSRKTGREVSDSSCSFKKGEGQRRLDLIDWIPPNQSSAGGEKKKPLIHHAFWKRIAEKVFQYFGLCWSKTRLDIYPSIEDSSSCILYRKKPFLKKKLFFLGKFEHKVKNITFTRHGSWKPASKMGQTGQTVWSEWIFWKKQKMISSNGSNSDKI